jgi:Glycosyl hydrolase family 26
MRGKRRAVAIAGLVALFFVLVGGAAVQARLGSSRPAAGLTTRPSPGLQATTPAEDPAPPDPAPPTAAPAVPAPTPTAAPAAPPAPATAAPAAPAAAPGPVQWGLWEPGWQGPGDTTDLGALTRVDGELGHRGDLLHWFANWSESWDYDGGLLAQALQAGRTPMITWEAWDRPLGAIAAGQYDGYIDSWARGLAASRPHTVYLRLFHEFNDPRDPGSGSGYPWGVGGGTQNKPADLVAAWRHVHDRFAAAGATNVRFVWCPDGVNLDASLLRAAYPGDGYVDDAGWDTYGYDNAQAYAAVGQVSQRPFVLPEVGATDPAWVRGLTTSLRSGRFPRVRALVWFDEGSSRLDANPAVRTAVREMLVGPPF